MASPALTGLSFPTVVDLSSGAQQVTFSLSASDPAGLGNSVIFFTNPIVLVNPDGSTTAVSGINVSGTTPTTVTVSPLTPIETDTVSDLALIDAVGNRSDYTSSQLAALNLPSAITFTQLALNLQRRHGNRQLRRHRFRCADFRRRAGRLRLCQRRDGVHRLAGGRNRRQRQRHRRQRWRLGNRQLQRHGQQHDRAERRHAGAVRRREHQRHHDD
jgi:hypothetical protein